MSSIVKIALLASAVPLFWGCVERQVVYRPAPGPAPGPVVTEEPPPPPAVQSEVVTVAPGPVSLWLWAPGVWEWRGRWVWTPGRWMARPHPGAVWIGAHWGWHGHRRVWVSGGWR
jgi:hypothetical protein